MSHGQACGEEEHGEKLSSWVSVSSPGQMDFHCRGEGRAPSPTAPHHLALAESLSTADPRHLSRIIAPSGTKTCADSGVSVTGTTSGTRILPLLMSELPNWVEAWGPHTQGHPIGHKGLVGWLPFSCHSHLGESSAWSFSWDCTVYGSV